MSLYDYRKSLKLGMDNTPFYALIMAAMIRADSNNLSKLCAAFPEVWAELKARYNAPGGVVRDGEYSPTFEQS